MLNKEDTKIEQALLDLNDLKSEMYKDKKENSAGDLMRKTTTQQKMLKTYLSDNFG